MMNHKTKFIAFLESIEDTSPKLVSSIIEAYELLEGEAPSPRPQLKKAIRSGDVQLVQKILPNVDVSNDSSLLLNSAFTHHSTQGMDIVNLLIDAGAKPDERTLKSSISRKGYMQPGSMDGIKRAMEIGAHKVNPDLRNTLTNAASSGNVDMVKLLASLGAKPTDKTLAMGINSSELDVVKYLVDELGLQPNEKSIEMVNSFHIPDEIKQFMAQRFPR